ncbi:hypothetical protein HPB50_004793 [Hyalomma asiaticum]|uniref:Uncharacterized protein n=1 Tax=Hyalomma asiaticum TaxID=266040 RepID=A0ACB7SN78_HYAAI|nr:hypothetical protein HPB50_004793 [Hyalomma asiaticum]
MSTPKHMVARCSLTSPATVRGFVLLKSFANQIDVSPSYLLIPLLLFDAIEPNSQESPANATPSVATLKLPEF